MIERYSPPGNLVEDVDSDAGLLQAWSQAVSDLLRPQLDGIQYFDQTAEDHGELVPRRIPWITMPAFLANGRKRHVALEEADARAGSGARREHQPEYSEWFTHLDGGRVIRVDVTTELPEYWETFLAKVRPDKVLDLYRHYVSPDVSESDLFDGNGVYNPLNRFNSADGAMHMTCGINTANAAFGVVGGAMPWRERNGIVVDLQECREFSTAMENADPALIAHTNRLSREQRFLTFADPPGIHILGLDLDGWTGPDGQAVTWDDVVWETRGAPFVRLRIEGKNFALWQCTIDGEPIRYGSQIAERITVGPTLGVTVAGTAGPRTPEPCGTNAEFAGRRA